MTQNLNKFLQDVVAMQYATEHGTKLHKLLQNVVVDDVYGNCGDENILAIIAKQPELKPFFVKNAKTEVPVAGMINGCFVSRRIDRLVINSSDKTIMFIDYKTNLCHTDFYDKYKIQLSEYAELLHSAYPNYKIAGFILWTRDWCLERVVSV